MRGLSLSLAATLVLSAMHPSLIATPSAQPAPRDDALSALYEAGATLATLTCMETPDPSTEADAAATLTDAIGLAMGATYFEGDESSVASQIAERVSAGFGESQTCSCEAAQSVLTSQVPAYVLSGEPSPGTVVSDTMVFSQEHCKPGTVDGVLDQDATTCIALSAGNMTELSVGAGQMARAYVCGNATDPATIAATLARATVNAMEDGEKACSAAPSVRCALTDQHIQNIALAQIAGMVSGYSSGRADLSAPSCDCTASLGTARVAAVLNTTAVQAHAATCSGISDLADTYLVLATEILEPVASALKSSVGTDQCSGPSTVGTQRAGPSGATQPSSPIGAFLECAAGTDRSCCSEGFQCVNKNTFYSQCRPIERAVPTGWTGTIVACVEAP